MTPKNDSTSGTADLVLAHLRPLIGLPLSAARRAADLRNFQFGQMRPADRGTVGEYALHIQCPWRIEALEGVVTGRSDLWEPTEVPADFDWHTWKYDHGNLQDSRLQALLQGCDPQTRSIVNTTGQLVVEAVEADRFGGAVLSLSGGYRLVLFPAGSAGEDWRIFQPGNDESHFVISGGTVEDRPPREHPRDEQTVVRAITRKLDP